MGEDTPGGSILGFTQPAERSGVLLVEKQWVLGLNLIGAIHRCVTEGQEMTSLCL